MEIIEGGLPQQSTIDNGQSQSLIGNPKSQSANDNLKIFNRQSAIGNQAPDT
jgi:hypothetical protein